MERVTSSNEKVYEALLDVEAVSLNAAYPTNRSGRRYLATHGTWFKEYLDFHLPEPHPKFIEAVKSQKQKELILYLVFGFNPIWFGTGNPVKKDISNYVKLLEDAVVSRIGLDDAHIFESHVQKVQALGKPCFYIRVELCDAIIMDRDDVEIFREISTWQRTNRSTGAKLST